MTPLSPEPWGVPPEAAPPEPQMWQPPPPRKRSPLPYVLTGAGVVLLAAVALAIVFWPSSNGDGTPPISSPAQQQSPGTQGDPASGAAPKLNQQAGQVDTLLTEMAGTRGELGNAVTGGCQTTALEQIRTQRQEQLDKAKNLQVDALENGAEMRDALVRALEASIESNQQYLDTAPGCPTDDEVRPVNQRASEAKNEFIWYWRPNAERAGLEVRDPDSI